MTGDRVPGSFRDPAGYVFSSGGQFFRQVNRAGQSDFDLLHASGVYEDLTAAQLLIPHENLGLPENAEPEAYAVLRPRLVPTVSYPHEWCFSQVRDAALTTLTAQQRAWARGMSLKDASAYNVQFLDGRPVLIDTLSFERAKPGPWVAYRQFCRHFLAPLALMAHVDENLGRLTQVFIDGVPLATASRMLPRSTWLRRGPLLHIHLHALSERGFSHQTPAVAAPGNTGERATRGAEATEAVVGSLRAATARFTWKPRSAWAEYYGRRESYASEALEHKVALVSEWLDRAQPTDVWDLGANTGRFSRLASDRGIPVVAFDQDVACVERMYLEARSRSDHHLLPLVMDLANPSPPYGWAHEERASLIQRGPADLAMALALVHHLAIGNNVPFDRIADFLARVSRQLFVEFVPKTDPMVMAMLQSRADIFTDYSESAFEAAFAARFSLLRRTALRGSERVLYWMQTR